MLFDERVAYKPFDYPEYDEAGWLQQSLAFWMYTEISMQKDIKNWNEDLTEAEKNVVKNILLGFAQTECAVRDYWTTYITKWFPKYEIIEMATAFGYFETIHAKAYSYLNESLGLTDFEAFLYEPTMAARYEALIAVNKSYTPKILRQSHEARVDVARSIAIFSAFTEGVALYSSFAVLYSFSRAPWDKLKAISRQMKFSVKDESLHSKMGCYLFRHMCRDYPELKEAVRPYVEKAANLILKLEENYIKKLFEMGDIETIKSYDVLHFQRERTNIKCNELGYEDLRFDYDSRAASQIHWFYEISGGVAHADFLFERPTDYSKTSADQDWDDMFGDDFDDTEESFNALGTALPNAV